MGWGRVKSSGFQMHLAENRGGGEGLSLQVFSCIWRKKGGGGESGVALGG